MRKFILPVLILLISVSCNKKETVSESEETLVVDSVKPEIIPVPVQHSKLVEYTPEQTSEFLQNEKNDTLYVTNFFATWCRPCMVEIPHFKQKMKELEGKPIKFTFISLDDKSEWDTSVKNFAEENNLSNNIVLLDGSNLDQNFFIKNFKTWKGETIPFTYMRKGKKTDETNGSMSKEELDSKLALFN